MTTYKKPAATSSLLANSRTYHDFEMESGISKKVNCLTAFAAVALIVALAALSLAIMLLFQGPISSTLIAQAFQTTEMEISNLSALQERVKQLEDQIGAESSIHKVSVNIQGSPNDQPTILLEESPSNPLEPILSQEDEDDEDDDEEGGIEPPHQHLHPILPEPVEKKEEVPIEDSSVPSDSEDSYIHSIPHDDDEDHAGSGDCPVYPRPICPEGYMVCLKDGPCSTPNCCKLEVEK